MPRQLVERLPFAPLEAALGDGPSALARRCGVDRKMIYEWRALGVRVYTGDVLSVRAGLHPGEVWPDRWSSVA